MSKEKRSLSFDPFSHFTLYPEHLIIRIKMQREKITEFPFVMFCKKVLKSVKKALSYILIINYYSAISFENMNYFSVCFIFNGGGGGFPFL